MGSLDFKISKFNAKSYVILEGDSNPDYFYIIHKGSVKVSKTVSRITKEGDEVLKNGDFFGVESVMSDFSRISTVLTLEDTVLIGVRKDQFPLLLKKTPKIAIKIIKKFSTDLRHYDELITSYTTGSKKKENPEEVLYKSALYYYKENNYPFCYRILLSYLKTYPKGMYVNECKQKAIAIKPYVDLSKLKLTREGLNSVVPDEFMLFPEGEQGDKLFIIQKGMVNITKVLDNKEVLIAVLKDGDIFGEMALLENKPRTASAITSSKSKFLVVDRKNFFTMVESQPALATKLIQLLSERIWIAYRQLENTIYKNPHAKIWDMLLIQLQKNRIEVNSSSSFTFPFSFEELLKMVSLPVFDLPKYKKELVETKKFEEYNDRIICKDVSVIKKFTDYYKKMLIRENKLKKNREK